MIKLILIFGSLCSVSSPGFSETYTIKFGDLPGGLEIQYEVNKADNKIVGAIKNTSAVSIGCKSLHLRYNGSKMKSDLGDDSRVLLDPGASQNFSWRKPSPNGGTEEHVDINKIESWFGPYCYTNLLPEFNNQSETKIFGWGTITGLPRAMGPTSGITLALENNSDQPVEIDWIESSLIDFDNSVKKIIPQWAHPSHEIKSIPNSIVPPGAKLDEYVTPKENYHPSINPGSGWALIPLIPSMVKIEEAEKIINDKVGGKFSLILQLVIEGKKTPVTFDFEVKSIKTKQPQLLPKGVVGM